MEYLLSRIAEDEKCGEANSALSHAPQRLSFAGTTKYVPQPSGLKHLPWIFKILKFLNLQLGITVAQCVLTCLKPSKKGASNGPVRIQGKFKLQPLVTWFSPL